MWRLVLLLLCLVVAPASAREARAPEAVAAALERAVKGWAAAQGMSGVVMALRHEGQPLRATGFGRDAGEAVELASLGKAITAVCAVTLIRDGHWGADTTSRQVLGYGPEDLTLKQLMTHTGGLRPDATQILMRFWLGKEEAMAQVVSRLALKRPRLPGAQGRYFYNNENYAVIGAMIEVELARPYAEACAERVLVPAGVHGAALSPLTGGTGPWGGWTMSVAEYAAFHDFWYGAEGLMRREIREIPWASVWGPVQYGAGMYQREALRAVSFWHSGSWCLPGGRAFGSFALHWRGAWGVVVAHDGCADAEAVEALHGALVKALGPP